METGNLIVLRTIKQGESNLIVHGLSRNGARLHFLARGALRSRKRFGGGVLEPLNYISAVYTPAKDQHNMAILSEAKLIQDFSGLRTDYDKMQVAFYFLQMASKISQEGSVGDHGLFDLLGNSLTALETATAPEKLRVHFIIKLLAHQGVLPVELRLEELLNRSVRQNNEVALGQNQWQHLGRTANHYIQQYMQGLS